MDRAEVERRLDQLSADRSDAVDDLVPALYKDLRRLAAAALKRERTGHTLQPTALVHEVYLRLAGQTRARWKDRAHFVAVAAQVMRRILVDHSRRRRALKRGGLTALLPLDAAEGTADETPQDVLSIDLALDRLAAMDARQAHIVELRFFGGLTEEEIGAHLDLSARTVRREWRVAKAWLKREMAATGRGPA